MPTYRRNRMDGGIFFFTVVARHRQPVFTQPRVRAGLRDAVRHVRALMPFEIEAWVLLPDRMHSIWRLPDDDASYAFRWALIKRTTSKRCGRRLWEPRFREHAVQDDDELRLYRDYCYWTPVKHGLVQAVADWPYSTFHRDMKRGLYARDWYAPEALESLAAELGE